MGWLKEGLEISLVLAILIGICKFNPEPLGEKIRHKLGIEEKVKTVILTEEMIKNASWVEYNGKLYSAYMNSKGFFHNIEAYHLYLTEVRKMQKNLQFKNKVPDLELITK